MTMRGPVPLRLARDACGAMAVETALVAPALALLALGTFDVSNLVSKQEDLQSAASEATQIVLSAAGGTGISSSNLKQILTDSLHSSPNLANATVDLTQLYRCDAAASTVTDPTTCDSTKPIYQYVQLEIKDSYTPLWTNFGVGQTINYDIVRTVQTA